MTPLRVTIYGAGYVGLVTGVCLASLGHSVLIVDHQPTKIADLLKGICPIFEPGLEPLLKEQISAGRLNFTTELLEGVAHGTIQFIAVGTPTAADASADLQYVFMVVDGIAAHMNEYRIVVNKSTAPPGTTRKIQLRLAAQLESRGLSGSFSVVANPEFLKQGAAVEDFLKPDRIIIGVDEAQAEQWMADLYRPLCLSPEKWMVMDPVSAELTKYAANAYLATRISFINEMSQLAELFGADIEQVRRGMGSDRRIGSHFLAAGCGFGGSCFPKDVLALKTLALRSGFTPVMLEATESTNQRQKRLLFKKIQGYFGGKLSDKVIALWGLSFKPNTDDLREAPSLVLIEDLLQSGARIQAFDPVANSKLKDIVTLDHSRITLSDDKDAALVGADILVIVTEWDIFRQADFAIIQNRLRHPVIVDGRNLYDPVVVKAHGLTYLTIGRPMR